MTTPFDAWVVRRILADLPLNNGEIDLLSGVHKAMAGYLDSIPLLGRQAAIDAMLAVQADRDAIITALANVDPLGPCPAAPKRRAAHTGDLSAANESSRFTWRGWITRSHFTLLSSNPKVGKTRLCLELAKRILIAELWPDGQPATFPAGTRTLWVPGDRHQDELRAAEKEHGLPLGTILFNALPGEPYGGWSLDNPDNVKLLRELIEIERPGLVFIDTVWRATRRRLNREDEVNIIMDPIITIAQETDTAIMGLMHLSKEMETLGRRLEGLARGIIKMTKPDSSQPNRRCLESIGNFKEPPPLGITIRDGGCDFDPNPPSEPARNPGGRPPEKLDAAIAFINEKLSISDMATRELVMEWKASGEAEVTFLSARKKMIGDGLVVLDDSGKYQVCHLIKP